MPRTLLETQSIGNLRCDVEQASFGYGPRSSTVTLADLLVFRLVAIGVEPKKERFARSIIRAGIEPLPTSRLMTSKASGV